MDSSVRCGTPILLHRRRFVELLSALLGLQPAFVPGRDFSRRFRPVSGFFLDFALSYEFGLELLSAFFKSVSYALSQDHDQPPQFNYADDR